MDNRREQIKAELDRRKAVKAEIDRRKAISNKPRNLFDLSPEDMNKGREQALKDFPTILKNLAAGGLQLPQDITSAATGGYAPSFDWKKEVGAGNTPGEETVRDIGYRALPTALAGPNLLAQTLMQGGAGALKAPSGEKLKAGVTDALSTLTLAGLLKIPGLVGKGINKLFPKAEETAFPFGGNTMPPSEYHQPANFGSPNKSEFNRPDLTQQAQIPAPNYGNPLGQSGQYNQEAQFGGMGGSEFDLPQAKLPPFLQSRNQPQINMSDQMGADISHAITGGKTMQQQAKEIAGDIKNSFEDVTSRVNERYSEIWNHPNIQGEKFEFPHFKQDYKASPVDYTQGTDLYNSYQVMRKDPSLENMHNFKQELGGEIGWLNKQGKRLLPEDRKLLDNYRKQYKAISTDIDNAISKAAPELKGKYAEAGQYWLQEKYPYYLHKDLLKMGKGQLENPKFSTIKSIFKSPSPEMQKVANDLGEEGKTKIAHIGMGNISRKNTAKNIISAQERLETNAMEGYLPQQHHQEIERVRGQVESEKQIAQQQEQLNRLAEQIEAQQNKAKSKYSKQPSGEVNIEPAQKEVANKLKEVQKEFAEREATKQKVLREAQEQAEILRKERDAARSETAKKESESKEKELKLRIKKVQDEIDKIKKQKEARIRAIVSGAGAGFIGYHLGGIPGELLGNYLGAGLSKLRK